MTHDEWLAANDPHPMLEFLRESRRLNDRKARLFACACVRRVWDLLTGVRGRTTVEVAERFADGRAGPQELGDAFQAARESVIVAHEEARKVPFNKANSATPTFAYLTAGAADAASYTAFSFAVDGALFASNTVATTAAFRRGDGSSSSVEARIKAERQAHAALLRDIFGDPFLPPPSVAPAVLEWNAGMVPQLARTIYEQGRFQDLPILADALVEAGSINEKLLQHFRGGGPHVKECDWLDVILGKK